MRTNGTKDNSQTTQRARALLCTFDHVIVVGSGLLDQDMHSPLRKRVTDPFEFVFLNVIGQTVRMLPGEVQDIPVELFPLPERVSGGPIS